MVTPVIDSITARSTARWVGVIPSGRRARQTHRSRDDVHLVRRRRHQQHLVGARQRDHGRLGHSTPPAVVFGAGDENRTRVTRLEVWDSAIELHPRGAGRPASGRGDLNPRPPAPKAGALPGCATPRREQVRSRRSGTSCSASNQALPGCATPRREQVRSRRPNLLLRLQTRRCLAALLPVGRQVTAGVSQSGHRSSVRRGATGNRWY